MSSKARCCSGVGSVNRWTQGASGSEGKRPLFPPISADRATINEGQPLTLSWSSSNADSASINQGIGPVPPNVSGSRELRPPRRICRRRKDSATTDPGLSLFCDGCGRFDPGENSRTPGDPSCEFGLLESRCFAHLRKSVAEFLVCDGQCCVHEFTSVPTYSDVSTAIYLRRQNGRRLGQNDLFSTPFHGNSRKT